MDARDTLTRLPTPFTGRQWWAWFDAWEHVDLIELITMGEHPAPQLTTGPAYRPLCQHNLSLITGSTRQCPWCTQPPRVLRCTCWYVVGRVTGTTGITPISDRNGNWHGRWWGVWHFRIDTGCPHHGDRASPPRWRFESTLGEDERRGH